MDPTQLKEVLRLHKLWLAKDPQGMRANLTEANLSGAVVCEKVNAHLVARVLQGEEIEGWTLRDLT